ncbi:MAG: DNA internalization-related competence protein ComEC/Rec2, partial [Planctomycetia bacterium]
SAMLLGSRNELDPELKSAFVETGTMHLLAISGLHVGLLAWFLFFLFQICRVSPAKSAILVALIILFYAILTDARPPVIRATILVWVFCLSQFLNRDVPGFNSLAAAGLIVMVMNPASFFQVGTQLSFLAVATILWFIPTWRRVVERQVDAHPRLLDDRVSWQGLWFWLNRSVRYCIFISLTIWLITLPLTMARFHLISPIGPVMNVVLWIPVTIALVSGFLFLVVCILCPPLAVVLAGVVNQAFHFIDWIVSHAAELPGSHFWVAGPCDWWLLGFYLLLGMGLFLPRQLGFPRWPRFAPIAWIGIGLFIAAMASPPKELRATFIAVGHGSSTLIQTTSGENILCDCGCFASGRDGADTISRVLWDRGVRRLDGVFLSHADADHYNALPGLLERFHVKTVYIPPRMFLDEPDSSMLAALHQAIDKAEVEVREIQAGDRLRIGKDCCIDVLHPAKRYALESNNANSMVLLVEHAKRRMLLPGDLQLSGINALLAEGSVDCDVLLVPHHGSRNSSPAELARWCRPEHAIVSSRAGDLHSDTKAAYQQQGACVYQTNHDGAIDVTLGRNCVAVTPFVTGRISP